MSNYYSMALLASMYNSSSSTSNRKSKIEMDKDRYFDAVLNGPDSPDGRVPTLRVIYALPKESVLRIGIKKMRMTVMVILFVFTLYPTTRQAFP